MKPHPETGRLALIGLLIIAICAVLQVAADVLIPFAIAAFVAIMVYPMVIFLARHKIPKVAGVLLVLACVGGVLTGVGYLITINIETLIHVLPDRITVLLGKLYGLRAFLESYDINLDYDWVLANINVGRITQWAGSVSGSFVSLIASILLVVVFAILMILEAYSIEQRVKKAFPNDAQWLNSALEAISDKVKGYMIAKTGINTVVGVLTWLICWLMNLDTPVLWGILAFLFSYIPVLGPLLSVALPTLLALIQFNQLTPIVVLLSVLILIHGVLVNLAEPKVYGSSLQLSPLMILVSLIFWTWTWGIAGAFLSVPLLAVLKIITAQFKSSRPVSILLGQ